MLQKLKNFLKTITKSCAVGLAVAYLSYFLVFGKSGIINYVKNNNTIEEVSLKEGKLERKLNNIKNKVERMYVGNLDEDLLDEQYRRATGEISHSEIIYYYE